MLRILSLLLAFTVVLRAQDAPFEIQDGDRVVFLGDVLLERENSYGHIEARLASQFRDRRFTVRNLSWAGETPRGWSRASFDSPEKGYERLKEHLAVEKPTLVFLGFGMAASLQELTDRSRDIALNPDPARYGAEPMSAARFKRELGELMDAIKAIDPAKTVRFVLLSPLRHMDLRPLRPGLPDPAAHNALLADYTKATRELANERSARFVDLFNLWAGGQTAMRTFILDEVLDEVTPNGIHLSAGGYAMLAEEIAASLGWVLDVPTEPESFARWQSERSSLDISLRELIVRKNDLFFHRFRPANSTYLFGFRKHEQGQNAVEILKFDPLIATVEQEIEALKQSGRPAVPPAPETPAALAKVEAPAHPGFQIADGYQIDLWAENPLLEKPVQVNWDAAGRLWVASSSLYPQIAPGEKANDKILILEDKDRDGKAETSAVFADGLLIPTAVIPDLVVRDNRTIRQSEGEKTAASPHPTVSPSPHLSPAACYVGQSTELLHLADIDGDGRADRTRIVFSGFGTEDTHHLIHTLRWGPDGRLFFNQSIYIHSHLETPWGMVRLNSGGVFAYDPRTERVEVYVKGFVNTWGLAWDQAGQSFHTDGAGGAGINWGFPGAMFVTYEGARQILPSISPGSYPKFCGLEIIQSPHFPAEWQGHAITCDFRAHRIVRFEIKDLSADGLSGFAATEQPDFIRTSDLSFRPIDVKLGPDGALYIADWSNPVINHGEVDFRDPRRDKHMGRIWRVTKKDAPLVQWEPLVTATSPPPVLLDKLLSKNAWEKEQSRQLLRHMLSNRNDQFEASVPHWAGWTEFRGTASDTTERQIAGMWLAQSAGIRNRSIGVAMQLLTNAATPVAGAYPSHAQTAAMRILAPLTGEGAPPSQIDAAAFALNPRVRLEGMRSISRVQAIRSVEVVLQAALNQPGKDAKDPFYNYAAWLSINDLATVWVEAIQRGEWVPDSAEKQQQLAWGLGAIRPELSTTAISKLFADGKIPLDGSGPWIELLGSAGGPKELRALFDRWAAGNLDAASELRAVLAFTEAARSRNTRPEGDLAALLKGAAKSKEESVPYVAAIARLLGLWKIEGARAQLTASASAPTSPSELRSAALEALRLLGGPETLKTLAELSSDATPLEIRHPASLQFARMQPSKGIPRALAVLAALPPNATMDMWRNLLAIGGASDHIIRHIEAANLPKPVLETGVRAAREAGKNGRLLLAKLAPLAGVSAQEQKAANYKDLAAQAKQQGDAVRGEFIYRRTALACTTCHAIGGAGGKVGPDMTSIGASAPLDYLIESLLDPAAKVKEGYNAVNLTLKDSSVVMGIQARESATELVLRDATGAEKPVAKAQVATTTNIGSLMPAGLLDQLQPRERLDLYAFLSELGKPGPFDASKGAVARVWKLAKPGETATGLPVYTLVDGRLVKDLLADKLPMFTDAPALHATARFQGSGGKTRLKIVGARKAWLDGQPLDLAQEIAPDLNNAVHTLTVELDPKNPPEALRAESPDARFLGD